MARYTQEYLILSGNNDGYVNHTLSSFDKTDLSLLLNWQFWDDNGYCDLFIGFENINIPKNSRIIAATLRLNVYQVDGGYIETEIKASLGNTFPANYGEFDSLVGTENYIDIHLDISETEQIINYDIKNIIQEKINQIDWVEGNNIIFFTENTNGETAESGADFDSFEYNPIAKLSIVFEPPVEITLREVLTGSRQETFKYQRLTLQNGKYKHFDWLDNYIEHGNIRVDFESNLVGSANFKMTEIDNINYLSDLIRPWYCVNYLDVSYEFPLGTYMLISPLKQSDGMSVSRDIQGYDLLYALEQDKFSLSVFYSKGDNVTDIIKEIIDGVGSWVNYSIPDSEETLLEDMSYEIGKSKLFVINSLLNTINYYPLWCSGNGVYRSFPWSDVKSVSWEFEDNENSLYESGVKVGLDYSQMYNKVIVIAAQLTADTEPLISILTFEDEGLQDHPLSYTSLGRYIVKRFDSEAVSQEYVDLRAKRELLKMLQIEESIEYSHAFVSGRFNDGLPFNGDCYKFKNTLLDIDSIYKIDSQTWELKTGSMIKSMIRRVTDV